MHEKNNLNKESRLRAEEWRQVWRVDSDVKCWRGHKSKRIMWFRKATKAEQLRCLKCPTLKIIHFRNVLNYISRLSPTSHLFSLFCSITCGSACSCPLPNTMKAQKKYGHFKLAVEWHGTWKQCQTVCALRICQFVRLALRTDSKPCWLYLCCWRCRSQSPALHLMLWLCWRPAQRRGSVEGSAPRAPVFVLEEHN